MWAALSVLFLDTEVQAGDFRALAATLHLSGYTLTEWRAILRNELAPVLGPNLLSVAGEWAGFDPAWLEAAVLGRPPRPILKSRWAMRLIAAEVQRLEEAYGEDRTSL